MPTDAEMAEAVVDGLAIAGCCSSFITLLESFGVFVHELFVCVCGQHWSKGECGWQRND